MPINETLNAAAGLFGWVPSTTDIIALAVAALMAAAVLWKIYDLKKKTITKSRELPLEVTADIIEPPYEPKPGNEPIEVLPPFPEIQGTEAPGMNIVGIFEALDEALKPPAPQAPAAVPSSTQPDGLAGTAPAPAKRAAKKPEKRDGLGRVFKCNICGKKFASAVACGQHKKREHPAPAASI